MSTGIIVVIIVAVIVVAALVAGGMAIMRRRRLQQRFGPEYDRVAGERDSKLTADSELAERERRVRDLDIQPLTDAARASYTAQWADIQERFVDAPADAVTGSQLLVTAVMTDRGYPTEHQDQVLADLSVEHSGTLGHYRAAEEISQSAASGMASTEDLRLAMIHYRALFGDLLGEPANAGPEPANAGTEPTATEPEQLIAADAMTPRDGDVYAAVARAKAADDPIASRQHVNGSDAQEPTK
jgi:Tfp pilus assembly protein PilX